MDMDLKLMIFGLQLLLLGGFIIISTASYYQFIAMTGFFLMFAGTFLSLIGLLIRGEAKAEERNRA